ncbi:hypothetical protein P152DRAFT_461399 [Eremomyces bilateralis CBS 781.70]|uniref:Uncharacterized protein n=1 Tax=Eremomyces bilateralis CBS 781.70 TaxID=1392243 RepID=A0A6G1FUU1_9PEZI|nr:uncharacterized protein P152DRAFT_461399 [Eremomyces bilateralis CBS 781.70]KAF1809452.1 hypothetical protein P152DRAFT_461399 [Eremomyces bilateralis CBS 781.70]
MNPAAQAKPAAGILILPNPAQSADLDPNRVNLADHKVTATRREVGDGERVQGGDPTRMEAYYTAANPFKDI